MHAYDQDGDFLVTVTVADDNGGGGSDTLVIAVLPACSLAGRVCLDVNNDGVVNFGDTGIGGVLVTLTGEDDRGPVYVTREIGPDGTYLFEKLRPGTYTLTETQPIGFADGMEVVGTAGGDVGDDVFANVILTAGVDGEGYSFHERPLPGDSLQPGQTASIGFWHNKHGQALIRSLNGDLHSTQLGNWLAATFPNLYGDLAGKTNDYVAERYLALFRAKGPKLGAEVMASALAVYVTNVNLAGDAAVAYGFTVSEYGAGIATFSVGSSGAAFDAEDGAVLTILDILQATDRLSTSGIPYDGDKVLTRLANRIYAAINETLRRRSVEALQSPTARPHATHRLEEDHRIRSQ